MEKLFDLEWSFLRLVADQADRVIEFNLWTTLLYAAVVLGGLIAIGTIVTRVQEGTSGTKGVSAVGQAITVLPVTVLYIVLFWILTGRFLFEYVVMVAGIWIVSQIYFLVVDSLIGLNDETKREKVQLMPQVHMNLAVGCITAAFSMLNIAVLFWAFYMALMASFRTDLDSEDVQARVSIFLFAIPAISGFLLTVPTQLAGLCNRLIDGEVRGYLLSRMLPLSLATSVTLVFPVFLFGDAALQYVPFLPTLDDLGWLPIALFGIFGVLPFIYSSSVHGALLKSRYQWRRKWLRDLSEALGNDTRWDWQRQSLVDEICRMVKRSPYFENYLVVLINDHYSGDEERRQELFGLFGMQEHAFDDAQLAILADHKRDLPMWDRLTAYVDDLFLYFHTLEHEVVEQAKIGQWQQNAAEIHEGLKPNQLFSPLIGMIVTGVGGLVMERFIPYIEVVLDQMFK